MVEKEEENRAGTFPHLDQAKQTSILVCSVGGPESSRVESRSRMQHQSGNKLFFSALLSDSARDCVMPMPIPLASVHVHT